MAVELVPTTNANLTKGPQAVPTSRFPSLGYKFEFFNPFQSTFCDEYDKDTNVVCSAPTGSGKTVIAEISTLHAVVNNGGRAIFLAPMKSLTLEKFIDWTKEGHPFAAFKPAILTGDFKLSDAKKKELQEAKVICMTSEMLDSRTRRMKAEGNAWLLEVTVLIVDEAHLIGMKNENTQPLEERGHKLESAIMRFTQLNKKSRIILLSATLPNLPQLGTWLEKLNEKKTNIIVSDYKPQPVEWHLNTYQEEIGYGSYHVNKSRMFSTAIETLRSFPNDMWLVFCHSKNDGRRIQSMINEEFNTEIPFHCADLEKDERVNIENGFKDKQYKIIIATSTLAYGVNLPARRVMILDSKRGLTPVHPYDIKQMGGRAGRPGIDPRGDVHWIVGDHEESDCKYTIDNMPIAESLMFDIDVFCFHIVAEIAEGNIKTRQQVWDWYNRTLAAHQGAKVDEIWMNNLISKLIEVKAITENGILKVTALGRIASWLYFSPFDVFHWASNLKAIIDSKRDDDASIAWFWGAIRSNAMDYLPKDCNSLASNFTYALKNLGSIRNTETACIGLWLQLQGKDWKDFPSSAISMTRNLVFDVERHAQALLLINKMWAHTEAENFIKMCALRIAYGVDKKAAMFCLLPKIGKVRAKNLVTNGILTIEQFLAEPEKCRKLVGPGIYDNTIEKAKELI